MNLLKELKRERGIAMLFITHDLALASDLCDRIAVVYAGQLRELGSAEAVLGIRAIRTRSGSWRASRGCTVTTPPGFLAGAPPDLRTPPTGCRFAGALPRGVRAMRRAAAAGGGVARARRALLAGAPRGVQSQRGDASERRRGDAP